jgi:hypothetical protein
MYGDDDHRPGLVAIGEPSATRTNPPFIPPSSQGKGVRPEVDAGLENGRVARRQTEGAVAVVRRTSAFYK